MSPPRGLVALACDLDRTLVRPGREPSITARSALRAAHRLGLAVVLTSGREYADLRRFSAGLGCVDALVAEDGAVVEAPVGSEPWRRGAGFARRVRARLGAVPGIAVGDVVVSVPLSERPTVLGPLRGLRVRLQPNVDRVMILPPDVTKSAGVRRALRGLGRGGGTYAAIGDAENDVELLRSATLSAAVANAIPAVRAVASYRCRRAYAAGVAEFVRGPLAERLRTPE